MKADEEIVYDFLTELSQKHAVSDATFQRAKQVLGEPHTCQSHPNAAAVTTA